MSTNPPIADEDPERDGKHVLQAHVSDRPSDSIRKAATLRTTTKRTILGSRRVTDAIEVRGDLCREHHEPAPLFWIEGCVVVAAL